MYNEHINGLVSKFAGNAKIGRVVGNEEGCQRVQLDTDQLQE